MKIKEGFVVREVGGKTVAVATGALSCQFHGMITLNGTGKFLFEAMKEETDLPSLVKKLTAEYDVDEKTAENAVKAFVESLSKSGILEA